MATNQTSVTVARSTTYALPISYATITMVDGIDHQEQLLLYRSNIKSISGLNLSVREERELGQIASAWLTLDETSRTITAITIPPGSLFTRDNGTTISYPALVASEPIIVLRKTVLSEPYVSWTTGSRITADQLNLNTAQLLGLIQETQYTSGTTILRSDSDAIVNPMLKALDAGAFKITNLGTPTTNNDAATKLYVDTGDATVTSYINSQIQTQLTNKLGAASGIATLDSAGFLNANQYAPTNNIDSAFFSGASSPVRNAGNLYDYGSLWYNTTNGRLYVYLFDDNYAGLPTSTPSHIGYWVDIASTIT